MVVRKAAARFDDLAQGAVQRLNRVGGVDHFVDVGRDGIRWYDMLPGPTPGLANRRIAFALLGLELLETNERHVSVHAGLYDGLRELRGDRLRKALETVDDRDQDVVDAAGFQLIDNLEPEFGALHLFNPKAKHALLVWQNRPRSGGSAGVERSARQNP